MANFEDYLDKTIPSKFVPFLRLPAIISLLIAIAFDIFQTVQIGRIIQGAFTNSFQGFNFEILVAFLFNLLFLLLYYKAIMVFTHRERAIKLFMNNPGFFIQYKSLHLLIIVYGFISLMLGSFNILSFVLMAILILSVQLGLYSYNRELRKGIKH